MFQSSDGSLIEKGILPIKKSEQSRISSGISSCPWSSLRYLMWRSAQTVSRRNLEKSHYSGNCDWLNGIDFYVLMSKIGYRVALK